MSTPNEERSHARLNVRCQGHIRIHTADSTTTFHSNTRGTVLVKDLSKSGIALLYHTQLFPGESFDVLFHSRIITATAVRCRRIDARCYEVGQQSNASKTPPLKTNIAPWISNPQPSDLRPVRPLFQHFLTCDALAKHLVERLR